MRIATVLRRFLIPSFGVSLYLLVRRGARVSPRAEVEIHPNLRLGRGVRISSFVKLKCAYGPLHLGDDTSIASGCMITANEGGLSIGRDCLIGPNVTIVSNTYRFDRTDMPIRMQGWTSRGVRIGNDVLVGAGCCILDGAVIGDGAVIAPNSVVSKAVPAGAVAQGNPARALFERR